MALQKGGDFNGLRMLMATLSLAIPKTYLLHIMQKGTLLLMAEVCKVAYKSVSSQLAENDCGALSY